MLPSELQPHDEQKTLTLVTHVLYALHTLAWLSGGVFAVIAIIINYIKRDDLPDAFFRSHFRWQIRTFWFTLLWLLLASPLWLLFFVPGMIAYTVIGLWYLYRCIKGWWRFAEGRALPLPAPLA
ncbi:DUF4870 family protein [Caldimonas tepidiphila]|uniref:DUF4870 family protein n=1 Tax=Caldimonas tepidiphila TaxID=2315841 RepID=UPI000E5AFFC5|nr:hypothetical protein [Caldimonas tepidiphila]